MDFDLLDSVEGDQTHIVDCNFHRPQTNCSRGSLQSWHEESCWSGNSRELTSWDFESETWHCEASSEGQMLTNVWPQTVDYCRRAHCWFCRELICTSSTASADCAGSVSCWCWTDRDTPSSWRSDTAEEDWAHRQQWWHRQEWGARPGCGGDESWGRRQPSWHSAHTVWPLLATVEWDHWGNGNKTSGKGRCDQSRCWSKSEDIQC